MNTNSAPANSPEFVALQAQISSLSELVADLMIRVEVLEAMQEKE